MGNTVILWLYFSQWEEKIFNILSFSQQISGAYWHILM
jgi:hypothetical protein